MANTVELSLSRNLAPRPFSAAALSTLDLAEAERDRWNVVRLRCTEGISQVTRCELLLSRKELGPDATEEEKRTIFDDIEDDAQGMRDADQKIADSEQAFKDATTDAGRQAAAEDYAEGWKEWGEETWATGEKALGRAGQIDSFETFEEYVLGVDTHPEGPWPGPLPPSPGEFVGSYRSVCLARGTAEFPRLQGRWFSGLVCEYEDLGCLRSFFRVVRVVLVPRVWLLSLRRDCHVFQNKTALDIVEELLTRAGLVPEAVDIDPALRAALPMREHCVQYNETDLDFIRRLLEEEGLVFWFRHHLGCDRMVVRDGGTLAEPGGSGLPTEAELLDPAGGLSPVLPHALERSVRQREDEVTWQLQVRRRLALDAATRRDFCASTPQALIEQTYRLADPKGLVDREAYEHPGATELATADDLEVLAQPERLHAQHRLEALNALEVVGEGLSNATALAPGLLVTIVNDRQPETPYHDAVQLYRQHRLIEVEHFAQLATATELGVDGSAAELPPAEGRLPESALEAYANAFRCIPHDRPYRTSGAVPKPRIVGLQTAIVLDGQGLDPAKSQQTDAHKEDWINVNKLGSVQVRFPWDRRGEPSGPYPDQEGRSCWIRVAQPLAGDGWGATFLPRAGMEVVVAFLNGDPDRPLITGCVHSPANPRPRERKHLDHEGDNRVETVGKRLHYAPDKPHAIPEDELHLNLIRTQSHVAGPGSTPKRPDGYNELSFCDEPGRERVRFHAENDFEEVVENDLTTTVTKDQLTVVQGDQKETVGQDQTLTVDGARTKKITGHERAEVGEERKTTINGVESVSVAGNRKEEVKGLERWAVGQEGQGGAFRELEVRGHRLTTVSGSDELTVKGERKVWVGGAYSVTGSPLSLEAPSPGGAPGSRMGADDQGNFQILAEGDPGEVEILAQGSPPGTEKPDGSLWLEGKRIELESSVEEDPQPPRGGVKFQCGEKVWLKVGPGKVELCAPNGVRLFCGGTRGAIGPSISGESIAHEEIRLSTRAGSVSQDPAAVDPEPQADPSAFFFRLKADGAAGSSTEFQRFPEEEQPDLDQLESQLNVASGDFLETTTESPPSNLDELADKPGLLITGDNFKVTSAGGLNVVSGKVFIQEKEGDAAYTTTRLLTEDEQDQLQGALDARTSHEAALDTLRQAEQDLADAEAKLKEQRRLVRKLEDDIEREPDGTRATLERAKAKERETSEKLKEATKEYEAADRAYEVAKQRNQTNLEQLDRERTEADHEVARRRNDHDLAVDDRDKAQQKHDEACTRLDEARTELEARQQTYDEARAARDQARLDAAQTGEQASELERQVTI